MTVWARLTWQAAVPDAFAPALAARLGVLARPAAGSPGAWTIGLGVAGYVVVLLVGLRLAILVRLLLLVLAVRAPGSSGHLSLSYLR